VTREGVEEITIMVAMKEGHVRFADAEPSVDQTVGVSTSLATARTLGSGAERSRAGSEGLSYARYLVSALIRSTASCSYLPMSHFLAARGHRDETFVSQPI
jgi:hypothetical protein